MSTEAKSFLEASTAPRYKEPFSLTTFARRNATQLGIFGVFVIVWIFFIVSAPQTFLAPQIYLAFMATTPFFGIMAMPLTMAVIAGEMDLSFPSIMAIGMVAFVFVFGWTGSVFAALIASLVMGLIAGLLNGVIVVTIGIPSLVATIGTQFFWRGAVLVLLGGKGSTLVETRNTLVYHLLVGKLFGYVPAQFVWMIIVAVVCWFLLNRHRLGAHIYLIGDNAESARLMGVNERRTRTMVFVLVGIASAFAGVLASLHVSFFWPSLGEGYLLETLASIFLGGTSVFGGIGTIFGSFLGSYIIGAIGAAIVAIGLTGFWTELIYGLIIIISVSMHAILQRRMGH
ncbi:MAG: ABC transporter permease [Chloroflexi bacterium]|nr:MAG: ABC transporter permease [Chloroflexota bacterium]